MSSSSIKINSNVASLQTQRYLSQTNRGLEKIFERLSSGLRITRASDDAAGLAISSLLSVDAKVYTQGIRNLNDGSSLLAVYEGALGSLSGIVSRLQELASQSANGVLTLKQRQALDAEAQALRAEYGRIRTTTNFNGLSLLESSAFSLSLQGGYGEDNALKIILGSDLPSRHIGTGTFQTIQTLSVPGADTGTAAYAEAADFNNDGNLDVAVIDNLADTSIFLGNGDGSFRSGVNYADSTSMGRGKSADINGDGNIDLVFGSVSSNGFNVRLGNGDGSFRKGIQYAGVTDNRHVDVGDINMDGIVDVVSGSFTGSSVSYALGNGDGTFRAQVTIVVAASAVIDVKIVDLDGDGKNDILYEEAVSGSGFLLHNEGSLTFSNSFLIDAPNGGVDFEAHDFNDDGYKDLVLVDQAGGVSTRIANGDGTFRATGFMSGLAGVGAGVGNVIAVTDYNQDGVKDLVIQGASVFLGNSNGTFSALTSTGASPMTRLWSADFNGDGIVDILSTPGDELSISISAALETPELAGFTLKTIEGARSAIDAFQSAQEGLSQEFGRVGSLQSRLQSAIPNLRVAQENYLSAASQISDADVAFETLELTRLNILRQAGSAVLAQANLQTEIAIRLLTA